MIGSGIFVNPGEVSAKVGSIIPTIVVWVVGCLLATLASLVYAEWGSRLPVSGGTEFPWLCFEALNGPFVGINLGEKKKGIPYFIFLCAMDL
jgi:hypothetical protein